MAFFCTKCGAELSENAKFCEKCGAPVEAGAPAKTDVIPGNGSAPAKKKYGMIGIVAAAAVVLAVLVFIIDGSGGNQAGSQGGGLDIFPGGLTGNGNDVLTHLRPWMGEWGYNSYVYNDQAIGLLHNFDNEGYFAGHILPWKSSSGKVYVHVNEEYIDFSDLTKDPKDCFLVSALTYYKTDFGADAFEDKDREIRIIFYDHFVLSQDYGKVMNIQACVGMDTPAVHGDEALYGYRGPFRADDGWAADGSVSFVKMD